MNVIVTPIGEKVNIGDLTITGETILRGRDAAELLYNLKGEYTNLDYASGEYSNLNDWNIEKSIKEMRPRVYSYQRNRESGPVIVTVVVPRSQGGKGFIEHGGACNNTGKDITQVNDLPIFDKTIALLNEHSKQ